MKATFNSVFGTRFIQVSLVVAILAVTFFSVASNSYMNPSAAQASSVQEQTPALREAMVAKLVKAPFNIAHGELASLDLATLKDLQRTHYASLTLNNLAAACKDAQAVARARCAMD